MKAREQIEADLLAVFDKEIAEAGLNAIMSSGGYCETARAGQRKETASFLRSHVVAAVSALHAVDDPPLIAVAKEVHRCCVTAQEAGMLVANIEQNLLAIVRRVVTGDGHG